MILYYRLGPNHEVIPLENPTLGESARLWDWAEHNRVVKQERIGDYFISTVFLVIDHSFGRGDPILFETMIFYEGGGVSPLAEQYMERYRSWDAAMAGHEEAVSFVKMKLGLVAEGIDP